MIIKEKVQENGHWYTKDGSPAYTINSKTGERATTLRDARKLGLLPSVTTIIGVLSKGAGLDAWKQQQVLLSALTLPKLPDEPEADWLARVIKDSKETGRKAADRGNDIHAVIESFYDNVLADWPPYVRKVEQTINEYFGNQLWTSERSFAHPDGFGGKVDLSSRMDRVSGWDGAIVDFKTKETSLDKVDIYFEHTLQLAAYRRGLEMPHARCAIVFVNGTTNEVKLVEIEEEELQKGWECYWHLLQVYQLKNNLK
jgi:hypothetical protein